MGLLSAIRGTKPAPARRQGRRVMMPPALRRMFDGAGNDRLTAGWTNAPAAADDIIRRNQRVLVARSREQCANNDYAKDFLRLCRVNMLGARGIRLQGRVATTAGKQDRTANNAVEAAWKEWCKAANCDVTGTQSMRQLQGALVNAAAMDGEFFVHIVRGRDAGPWGFALQIIDAQRCPPDLDRDRLKNGAFIRSGIEFNKWGRPIAYHFTTTSAIDEANGYNFGGRAFVRIAADDIVHGFVPTFSGQKRGLPWLSTALWRLRMLGRWEDAALVNALVGAAKMGFFENEDGEASEEVLEIDAEPGTFHELPGGVKFSSWNPQYPSGEYETFHRAALRGIAAGLGTSYHNLSRDLTSVNFSSIRQGTLDERETWMELQEWFEESLLQPVFDAWLPHALLSGRIRSRGRAMSPTRLDDLRRVEWQARRWQWIDPEKDVNAAVTAMTRGLRSPSDIIRESGRDPDSVWAEIASDIESMRGAGIPENYIEQLLIPKGASTNANNDQDEKPAQSADD